MTDRDALAALIAEMRSPYAGPGGCSSRSIADAILAAGWRPQDSDAHHHVWVETTSYVDFAAGKRHRTCSCGATETFPL